MLDLYTANFWQERHAEMVRGAEKNLEMQRSLTTREDETLQIGGRFRRLGERARALRTVRGIRRWADT